MPIQLPNLDDRTYDDLVAEGLHLIPTYAPEWTNYNPSDPGITLIELFAYITELLIYRLDRVTDENKLAFLKLINGSDRVVDENKTALLTLIDSLDLVTNENKVTLLKLINSLDRVVDENKTALRKLVVSLDQFTDNDKILLSKLIDPTDRQIEKSLDEKIQSTIQSLRKPDRAITCRDFERLTLDADPQIARAHCIPKINLLSDNKAERQGYISILIVPKKAAQISTEQLINVTEKYLDDRRLITTRISVYEPIYLKIKVQVKLFLKPDAADRVIEKAIKKLQQFFDPLIGGQTGTGWEFGRSIYISEIYELLDRLPEVDYAEDVTILKQLDGNPIWVKVKTELMEIALNQNQLIQLQILPEDIKPIQPDRQTLGGL